MLESVSAEERVPGWVNIVSGREAAHRVEFSNRDLLVELCLSHRIVVGNTLLPGPAQRRFQPSFAVHLSAS